MDGAEKGGRGYRGKESLNMISYVMKFLDFWGGGMEENVGIERGG